MCFLSLRVSLLTTAVILSTTTTTSMVLAQEAVAFRWTSLRSNTGPCVYSPAALNAAVWENGILQSLATTPESLELGSSLLDGYFQQAASSVAVTCSASATSCNSGDIVLAAFPVGKLGDGSVIPGPFNLYAEPIPGGGCYQEIVANITLRAPKASCTTNPTWTPGGKVADGCLVPCGPGPGAACGWATAAVWCKSQGLGAPVAFNITNSTGTPTTYPPPNGNMGCAATSVCRHLDSVCCTEPQPGKKEKKKDPRKKITKKEKSGDGQCVTLPTWTAGGKPVDGCLAQCDNQHQSPECGWPVAALWCFRNGGRAVTSFIMKNATDTSTAYPRPYGVAKGCDPAGNSCHLMQEICCDSF